MYVLSAVPNKAIDKLPQYLLASLLPNPMGSAHHSNAGGAVNRLNYADSERMPYACLATSLETRQQRQKPTLRLKPAFAVLTTRTCCNSAAAYSVAAEDATAIFACPRVSLSRTAPRVSKNALLLQQQQQQPSTVLLLLQEMVTVCCSSSTNPSGVPDCRREKGIKKHQMKSSQHHTFVRCSP